MALCILEAGGLGIIRIIDIPLRRLVAGRVGIQAAVVFSFSAVEIQLAVFGGYLTSVLRARGRLAQGRGALPSAPCA